MNGNMLTSQSYSNKALKPCRKLQNRQPHQYLMQNIRGYNKGHIGTNNLFSDKKFGFIPGRSIVLQLLHVLNIWTEIIDQGGDLEVVYCDVYEGIW